MNYFIVIPGLIIFLLILVFIIWVTVEHFIPIWLEGEPRDQHPSISMSERLTPDKEVFKKIKRLSEGPNIVRAVAEVCGEGSDELELRFFYSDDRTLTLRLCTHQCSVDDSNLKDFVKVEGMSHLSGWALSWELLGLLNNTEHGKVLIHYIKNDLFISVNEQVVGTGLMFEKVGEVLMGNLFPITLSTFFTYSKEPKLDNFYHSNLW